VNIDIVFFKGLLRRLMIERMGRKGISITLLQHRKKENGREKKQKEREREREDWKWRSNYCYSFTHHGG